MPRITVEHGGRFVHCVASQLQEVLRQLGDASPRGGGGGDVLTVATQVAASCLQLFAAPELGLVAPATGSFGTALRSRQVRALLGQSSVRGTPLLQVLEWIRAAADAQRHLVPALMLEARQAVAALLAEGAVVTDVVHPDSSTAVLGGRVAALDDRVASRRA